MIGRYKFTVHCKTRGKKGLPFDIYCMFFELSYKFQMCQDQINLDARNKLMFNERQFAGSCKSKLIAIETRSRSRGCM